MAFECKKCGTVLGEEHPTIDEACVECFADGWAEIVVESPMASPNVIFSNKG